MSFFSQIYQCALNNDDKTLALLLNQGACIDEKERSENFTTVAAQLVLDGHTKKAFKLINQFGAGPEYVLQALIETSQEEAAEKLKAQFHINTQSEHFDMLNPERRKIFYHWAYPREETTEHFNARVRAGDSTYVKQVLTNNDLESIELSGRISGLTTKSKVLNSILLCAVATSLY
ncbi:hypothetical protein ACQUW5_13430 [Legionella sp. CNM-1927-20]|uniref:hypothetical protein n=1 Tax=Legionella sp. CNM-1927-20 TaxID=3422221 RepID=UPI00403B2C90